MRAILRLFGFVLLLSGMGGSTTAFGQSLPYWQPVTQGRNVSFSAGKTAGTIQWQMSTDNGAHFAILTDGGQFSGTRTSVLEITGVTSDLNKTWIRYVAANNGATTISNNCTLWVSAPLFPRPSGISTDGLGNFYVTDEVNHTVSRGQWIDLDLRVNGLPQHLVVTPVAGNPGYAGAADGTGTGALFNHPVGVVMLPSGGVLVGDAANGTLRQVAANGVTTTLAGDSGSRGNTDGTGAAARFAMPLGVARAQDGTCYVADSASHTVRRVTPGGAVTTFAGSPGNAGAADGTGSAARFNNPSGVAVDGAGNVYVADTGNNLIRKITPFGVVTTIAGVPGVAGAQDGAGGQATFNGPTGIAVTSAGGLIFVADTGNSTVRMLVVGAHYTVQTFAGFPQVSGLSDGYDGMLDHPTAVAVDASSDYYLVRVYIADTGNAAIRVASWDNGLETLMVGEATPEFTAQPPVFGVPSGTPATTTPPATVPVTSTSTSSSSGGSGGGAVSGEFLAAFGALLLVRRLRSKRL